MSIDVNAIEQTVVVTAVGDEVNVNIIDQPVLVSVTDQIIEVEASGGTGPQGPAGAGVAAGGTTGQVLSKASNTNYDTVWVDAGAGTVYSVDASGSTGISVTGGPITGAGVLTITNTLPDQVVSLTGAGTAVITGTYPNFTITTNDEFDGTVTSVNLTAGTGIFVSGGPITSSGAINVVNTAPDQVVSLTGGGTTTISGTYPNFTISSADQYSGTVTSVNMTVPTGLTISGNPITSAGTLALALASGYSIPTTASQANWDSAYNDKINSASVTGTSTKTLTLNQQDGGTVTASWSDIDTGLTSVGLTMPSAFAVSNSPLTSNGTIAVTGAGTAAQYVRGDGQLATLPSFAGGGSSVNYYLNGSINASVAGYKQLSMNAIIGVGTNFTLSGNGLIAQFLTDINDPNRVQIPGGAWNFETYFSSSSNGGSEAFYIELLKYNGSTFTLIASSVSTPEAITGGTTNDLYVSSIAVPSTSLATTDRLAIRIYIVNNSGARTITLHTEDNNLCQVITTFAGGVASLNGLTANTQYFATGTSGTDFNIQSLTDTHTFNLPVASGSNTGKLSNTDWITFDGKENVLTFSAPLSRSVNTVSIPVANASQPGYLSSADWTTFDAKVTSVSATSPLFSSGGKTPTLTIQQSSGSQNGYLSSTDWTTFNNKQNAITLTTTGASGASTFIGSTLNIPTYTLTGLGGVPTTRQLTINGTAYDLSADRSWTIPVHDAVTIGTANGLSLSTQVLSLGLSSSSANGALSSTDWSTFNGKQSAITLTTTGSSGASTFISNTLNIPTYTLSGLGGVPTTRTLTINGTSLDLSANRTFNVGTVTTAAATTGGQVAFFNGATVITSVSGLYFDGVDKLGIGTASPTYNLDVTGTARMTGNLTAASFIKSGGTSSQYLMADGSTSTLTNPVTGTGTTNYLPKWTSGSALGNSGITDDGTTVTLNSRALSGTSGSFSSSVLASYNVATGALAAFISSSGGLYSYYNGVGIIASYADNSGTASALDLFSGGTRGLRVFTNGNIALNSSTDNGNRLQVTGNVSANAYIANDATYSKLEFTGGTSNGVVGSFGSGLRLINFTASGSTTIQGNADININTQGSSNILFGTSALERMRLTSSGNLGLGVVPSAWSSGKALEINGLGNGFWMPNALAQWQVNNAIYNGGFKYANNGVASAYNQESSQHAWFNAPSGTAGNAITFTQAMTLTASGRLLLGTTTEGNYAFTINDISGGNLLKITSGSTILDYYVSGGNPSFGTASNHDLRIKTNDVTRLTIASTGAATFSSSVTATRYLVTPDGSNNVYNFVNANSTYTGAYVMQAGEGSGGYGGSIIAYGHSHATKPGWITAGISAGSSGKFTVNTSALGGGTDVFIVQANGNCLVGTTTDVGERFQVSGKAYINNGGALYIDPNASNTIFATTGARPLYFEVNGANRMIIKSNGVINMGYLPTSSAGLSSGDIWNDAGTLKIV